MKLSFALLVSCVSAFQLPQKIQLPSLNQVAATTAAAAVSVHAEAAHAKSVLGVNGALDFGPLAVGYAFAQWQSYQDDADDDFFDTYDSRRTDRELTNRNRDDGGSKNY